MRRKNSIPVILLLLGCAVSPLSAENDTVHTFSFMLHSLADVDRVKDASYEAELLWEPEVYGYGERSEVVFRPRIVFPVDGEEEFQGSIRELRFSFFPTESLTFEAGKYIHDSSFAAFFSKTAFFRTVDYQELLKGSIDSAAVPSWLVEGTYFLGDWYVRGSVEPFRGDIPFFEVDSVWFPNLGFPEEIPSFLAPDGKIELEELRLVEPEARNAWNRLIEDIGGSLEIGGRVGSVDLMMLLSSGRDTTPLYTTEVVLKNLVDDYRIDLHPLEERLTSMGIAARTAFGPVVLFGEGAFSFNKPLMKETFYSTDAGFETESYTSPYIGITIGGRWEWWEANLLTSAEYTNGFILSEASRTVMPFFQQMALGSVLWTPLDGRLSCTAACVVAIEDGSVAGNLGITYAPGEGRLSVGLSMPLFFGSADSSFGQYREILYPTLSSSIRY